VSNGMTCFFSFLRKFLRHKTRSEYKKKAALSRFEAKSSLGKDKSREKGSVTRLSLKFIKALLV